MSRARADSRGFVHPCGTSILRAERAIAAAAFSGTRPAYDCRPSLYPRRIWTVAGWIFDGWQTFPMGGFAGFFWGRAPWSLEADDPDAQRDEGLPVLDRSFAEAYGAPRDRRP